MGNRRTHRVAAAPRGRSGIGATARRATGVRRKTVPGIAPAMPSIRPAFDIVQRAGDHHHILRRGFPISGSQRPSDGGEDFHLVAGDIPWPTSSFQYQGLIPSPSAVSRRRRIVPIKSLMRRNCKAELQTPARRARDRLFRRPSHSAAVVPPPFRGARGLSMERSGTVAGEPIDGRERR